MTHTIARDVTDIYPLATGQHGILAEALSAVGDPLYLQHYVLDVTGVGQAAELRAGLDALVGEYDVLRTCFVWDAADQPLQVVRAQAEIPLTVEVPDSGRLADRVADVLAEERATPFDLSRAPLLRVRALRRPDGGWRLVSTHHHLILDAWSMPLLFGRLAEILGGRPAAVPPRPARPFREFVAWQHQTRQPDRERAYFAERLGTVRRATPLGADAPRRLVVPSGPRPAGTEPGAQWAEALHPHRQLGPAARRSGVRPATIVHAAWALLLARWAGTSEVVFGTTVSGRPPELPGVTERVGMFVNTAVLAVPVPDISLADWLALVRRGLDAAREHEHAPVAEARQAAALPPGEPLLSSVLAFQNQGRPDADVAASGGVRVTVIDHAERTGLPVTVSVGLPRDGIWVRLRYDPDRVGPAEADWLAATLARLIADLPELPGSTPLAAIPVIAPDPALPRPPGQPDAVRAALAVRQLGWAAAAPATAGTPPPARSPALPDTAATNTAATNPAVMDTAATDTAVTDAGGGVTGAELGQAVGATATRLRATTPDLAGEPVPVMLPSGIPLVAAILAVLASGGRPVVVDPGLPADERAARLGPSLSWPAPTRPAEPSVRAPAAAADAATAQVGLARLGGIGRTVRGPGLDGLAFGATLIWNGLGLGPGDRVLAVLAASDPLTPSVIVAAMLAGSHLDLREPADPAPPGGATVLIAPWPVAAERAAATAPGARIAIAGDPPPPSLAATVTDQGRTLWRLWASGHTGGADACAAVAGPADTLTLGSVPGARLAGQDGHPVPPGRDGELELVLPDGPRRTGIRARRRDQDGADASEHPGWEQLGRTAEDELLLAEDLLARGDGVRAAVITGPDDAGGWHAWLAGTGPDAVAGARQAAARLPAAARPADYTVVPELPTGAEGAVNRAALAEALVPADASAARTEPGSSTRAPSSPGPSTITAALEALPARQREDFLARLTALADTERRHRAAAGDDQSWWQATLADRDAVPWPVAPPGPATAAAATGPGGRAAHREPPARVTGAAAQAPDAAWAAAAATALSLLAGAEDVVLGFVGPDDHHPAPTGWPLRLPVVADQPFAATRAAAAVALQGARAHPGVTPADLDDLPGGPVTVSVTMRGPAGAGESPATESHATDDAPVSLDIAVAPVPEPVAEITARSVPGRAEPEDARRLRDLTLAVLRRGLAEPDRPVRAADLVGPARRGLLRLGQPAPAAPAVPTAPPGAGLGSLPEAIGAAARRTPDAIAVRATDGTLTYAELTARAAQLARRLRAAAVGPGDLVAVCLPRIAAMAWAPLGVLTAGAAYVPLSPADSPERARRLLADCRAVAVVTTAELADRFAETTRVDEPAGPAPEPGDGTIPPPNPRSLAYVLYTSGSSGRPKGVLVEHQSAVAFSRHIADAYQIRPGTRLLGFASLTFDVSVFELWSGLCAGATVVLAGEPERQSAQALQDFLARERVEVAELPPSLMPLLHPDRLPALRLVSVGGEAPAGSLVDDWATARREFWNGYGPTETTVAVTLMRCTPPSGGRVPPIGRPMPGHRAYVLDENLALVPPGVTGELCISGPGLARGYLGQPGTTAAAFVPDPYGPPGGRLYRTGDLARWTAAGVLEFAGRADGQVQIRGFRVEPGEVEAALAGDPDISQAVVTPWDGPDGTRHLLAYVVPADPDRPPELPAVRERASSRLAPYMLPTRLVVLEHLPVTASGKADRARLPVPAAAAEPASAGGGTSADAGWTEIERVLAREVIGPLVGQGDVGREDGFFHLGGNSLQVMQVTARVADRFGVQVSLAEFFRDPTVARLAALIEAALIEAGHPAGAAAGRPAEAAPGPGPEAVRGLRDGAEVPLSYPQASLLASCRAGGDRPAYHGTVAIRVAGSLDLAALRRAFTWLVERHPVLRATIEDRPGGPVQVVRPLPPGLVEVTEAVAASDVGRAVGAESARLFDLAHDLPLRVRVHRVGPADHVVQWTVHHIVIDGWSVGVLSRELSHAYAAIAAGSAPSLPRPAADYGDFVAWQRAYVAGPDCARDLEWWRGYLTGAAAVPALGSELGGEPGPDGEAFRAGWLNLELPPATAAAVRDLLRARGITLYMAVLAAQAILLSAETGSQDTLVVTPYSLRVEAGWEDLVGWFVNRVVVRPRVSPAAAFGELLDAVREHCIGVFAHGRVPFDLLREELALPGGTLCAQLSVQNAPVSGVDISGASVTHIGDDSGRDFAPLLEVYSPAGDWFRFSVMLRERYDGRIAGGLEYDAARVTEPTARRWQAAFLAVLAAGAADPGTEVRQLRSLVSDPDRARAVGPGGPR